MSERHLDEIHGEVDEQIDHRRGRARRHQLFTRQDDSNAGAAVGYEPNSHGQWQEQPDFNEPPLSIEGAADHWNHRDDDDYFSQPGALFRLMTPSQQRVLFENTARSLGGASKPVQERHIGNCTMADPAYGAGVAAAPERGVSPKTPNKEI